MNKNSYYKFFSARQVTKPAIVSVPVVEDTNTEKSLLDAIYAIDPVTKFPTGDIAMFLSDKTSPEVKQYIVSVLMGDTSSAALPPLPDGLDESTAFALERKFVNGSIEPLHQWRSRVQNFMLDSVDTVNALSSQIQSSDVNPKTD